MKCERNGTYHFQAEVVKYLSIFLPLVATVGLYGEGRVGEKSTTDFWSRSQLRTSSQDGGIGRHTVPPRTTKRKTTNLKTKTNQNCQKNRTVWKSNNQGVKEETFIQTSRRGRDRQPGQSGLAATQLADPERWRIVERTGQAVQQLADRAAPHSHIDILGGIAGE